MLSTVLTKTIRDRWVGMAVGAVSLAVLFLFGMAVYRDLDLSIYTDLPEAFRALVNIPKDADVGSLAYGAVYGSYGMLMLAGIAISMGSGAIAGEERSGTLGLLLGNPESRTEVLVSKAASIVVLTGSGALFLWGAGLVTPVLLDVNVGGMRIGALLLHMFINAVFYGFLAMAIGAWTGSGGLASGITAGVMIVSFVATGLLPLVASLRNLTKVVPWYYYQAGDPLLNGARWGHLVVLLGGIALFAGVAVVGVNRRDLRSQNVGVTLLDKLRANPTTRKVVDRLAGSARVSRIWIKTASEHQGLLIVTGYVMFLLGVLIGPMYAAIDNTLRNVASSFPKVIVAIAGGGDISTPEGFYQIEIFGLMAPIAVMVVTVVIGARALAGEEARRTMGLLLANPIRRSKVVLEKSTAMVLYACVVGVVTFAGVALGSVLGGLGMDMGNVAATSLLATLFGLAFGSLALALSAATGRVKVAAYVTVGVAFASHVFNSFLPLNERLAAWARGTPSYYYLGSDPLLNGMQWGHGALLVGLVIGLVALSVVLFQRRDLRQTG